MPTLQEWLEDPSAVRGVFVIATRWNVTTSEEEPVYLSSVGYTLSDASVSFDPIITTGINFREQLSVNGGTSLSYGDVEVYNPNGELDTWLDHTQYVWVNRPIQIYVGDPAWVATSISDFTSTKFFLVFNGIIADIDSKNLDLLNIKLVDKLQRLNTPVTEEVLGTYGTWQGDSPNKNVLKPLIFGEVHNIEPTGTDPAKLEYMVNNGLTEQIIEIRDNGVPIYTSPDTGVVGAVAITDAVTINISNATPDLDILPALGSFRLKHPAAGTITASVQGIKRSVNLSSWEVLNSTYSNNIAKLIALIVTEYGNASYKLLSSELDLTNLLEFSGNTQPVGIYLSNRENVINVCQALAQSIGAQLFMTRYGKLQLLRVGVPYPTASNTIITDSDILHHSLSISSRVDVVSAAKINSVKNWTVQEGIITGIPEDHKILFTEDYKKSASNDATHIAVKNLYRLTSEPEAVDSYLLKKADGDTEADRLVEYFKIPRTIYRFTSTSKLMSLTLGQKVTLIHNRFGLYNGGDGKIGQVVSFSPNWSKAIAEIEVII